MPDPRDVRVECFALITEGVAPNSLSRLKDLERRPEAVPMMAAAFAAFIRRGCTIIGATKNGTPDLERFEPSDRKAFKALPSTIPLQTRLKSRTLHREVTRHVRAYVRAGGGEQADTVYEQFAAANKHGQVLFMLWVIAVRVWRCVGDAAAAGHLCPICGISVVEHLTITGDRPSVYTCDPVVPSADVDPVGFDASRQRMFDELSNIIRGSGQ